MAARPSRFASLNRGILCDVDASAASAGETNRKRQIKQPINSSITNRRRRMRHSLTSSAVARSNRIKKTKTIKSQTRRWRNSTAERQLIVKLKSIDAQTMCQLRSSTSAAVVKRSTSSDLQQCSY